MLNNLKRKAVVVGTGLAATAASALPVLASEASGTANTAVVSAMTTVANDMKATGTAIIPVALTVVGLAIVVTFGIKMFKRIANK